MKQVLSLLILSLTLILGTGRESQAVTVIDTYLFSEWDEPDNETWVPFDFVGTDGVELTLNGSGVATSATDITSNYSAGVQTQLYYYSHYGTIDSGEGSLYDDWGCLTLECYVNKEIGKLDDAGLVNEGTPIDARLNIDFSDNSSVILRIPEGGIVDLWIFEDAGLDPFKLMYCSDATCSSYQVLFNGFTDDTADDILGRPDFGSDDYAPPYDIDQAFYFTFADPISGYIKIKETDNYGSYHKSTKLEIDFVGGNPPPSVPEPATILLLGAGLIGLMAYGRKKVYSGK
jgi:hypothetical protein